MKVTSPAFKDGEPIPARYSCAGENIHPELIFEDVPEEAKSLALIMDDPDAPKGTFLHWMIWNINTAKTGLPEGEIPVEAKEGLNGRMAPGYTGPCPPEGHGVHHYHFKLYALDAHLDLVTSASKEKLEEEISAHKIAEAELIGTYERV